jgi:hypothetical protein
MAAERGHRFNAGVKTDVAFEPAVGDGRCSGLDIPKSN